jgi:hypothetical protein
VPERLAKPRTPAIMAITKKINAYLSIVPLR